MDTLMIYGIMCVNAAKEKMTDFFKKERGGAEIIATIILIVIVVLLGVLFKDKIGTFVTELWNTIDGKTNNLSQDF